MSKIQMGVSLDLDLYQRIQGESKRRRNSMSDVIRNAVVEYFERQDGNVQPVMPADDRVEVRQQALHG